MPISGVEAAERLVLDTSAYAAMCRGHDEVLDWVASAVAVVMSVIVIGELEAGFGMGNRERANRVALADFLAEPFVYELPASRSTARHYGEVFCRLKAAGTPLPVNDIWIAAATLDCGGHLLTLDRDFARIDNLSSTVLPID